MQSIGERLEEGRKRRGVSIREASEATKIRGDFLLSFENNQFGVDLPDIYVRGFLRNYAGFLMIDPEKIVTDFNSTLIREPKSSRKDSRELFGRLEIPERPRPAVDGGTPTAPTAPRRRPEDGPETTSRASAPGLAAGMRNNAELGNYVKVGAIIAAGVAALLVIVWLVLMIINAAQSPIQPAQDIAPDPSAAAEMDTIKLIATDNVTAKVVQMSDMAVLFDGPLARGEEKTISRRGVVVVRYTSGANLQVEKDGRRYRMTGGDGIGQSTIP